MNIPKIVVLIALGGLLALLVTGCGGGSDGDSDPQELLDATFGGGGEEVSSGVLDISLEASSSGEDGGSLAGTLQGPFETRAEDQPPLVDLTAALAVQGGDQDTDFDGGLTITEDGGFVTFDGQAYEVDDATFELFSEQFAQSAATQQDGAEEGSALFEQFGIDPSNWINDVSNEGTEEIDGTETVHISGSADVARIAEDARAIDPTGDALGAADSDQLAESVQSATIDIYTGADDNILRRLDLALEVEDPGASGEAVSLQLSVGVNGVNEQQTIEAPADARPLEELIPGGIAALGGGLDALGGGAPGGPGGGGPADGVDLGTLPPEYQQCVGEARSPDDFAACNDLLR